MTMDLTGLTEKSTRRGTRYFEDAQGEIVAKECTGCSEVSAIAKFSADKKGLAGKRANCKGCVRKYREENVDKFREWSRRHYKENAGYYRKYREDNAEHYRKYRENHADIIREQKRKYYEKNAHSIREQVRKYREDNAERYRKYRENNKELYTAADLRRRARKRLLPDTFTESDLTEVTLYFEGGCSLTGDTDVHMDHVLPLTAGHVGTTYENMIPLRADLNNSKHNRNIFKWFREEKERFDLSQSKFDELVEYLADTNEMTTKEYRDFVYWCHDNPRTVEEIKADNERYGYMKPSSEIWREEVTNKGRELVEA